MEALNWFIRMSLPLFREGGLGAEDVQVIIRFSDASLRDLKLPIIDVKKVNINWLKSQVRSKISELNNKRLRFIRAGKVLNSETNFRKEFIQSQKFAVDNSNNNDDNDNNDNGKEGEEINKIFIIHCLVGDVLSREEMARENELDNQVQEQSTTPAPVGFDRLASAGFSQEDINALRQQFTQLYGDLQSNGNGSNNENERNDIRQLEERWIDSSVNEMDEFTNVNINSSFSGNYDIFVGILVGSILGILSIFFIKEDKIFNKRQKMAMVAGIIINFSFALVRQWA